MRHPPSTGSTALAAYAACLAEELMRGASATSA